MKYYGFISESISIFDMQRYDINKFSVKSDESKKVFKVCFDESNRDEFFEAIDYENNFKKEKRELNYIGEDGYKYKFYPDGTIEKTTRFSKREERKIWKIYLSYENKIAKANVFRNDAIKKYPNGITLLKRCIGGYDKYIYVNSENGSFIPFRFKPAKSKNAPLLVYYAGAGTLGFDNFKQLFEFITLFSLKRIPEDCNILLPQAYTGINMGVQSETKIGEYVKNVADIVLEFSDRFNVDQCRRYCFGTSFGGGCVWENIYAFEDIFAAAVPVMGTLLDFNKKLPVLVKRYKGMPIWMAHSSDDNNVVITSDDAVYAQLKQINPEIKYTRWEKYGHKMSARFYRQQLFIEWMFEQKKQISESYN